jgi:thymidylate kinase
LKLEWLNSLEEGLPKPQMVFVLDVTPRTSFLRKSRLRDFHEQNLSYLKSVRRAYHRLAREYGWRIVDGERESHRVHADLWTQIERI